MKEGGQWEGSSGFLTGSPLREGLQPAVGQISVTSAASHFSHFIKLLFIKSEMNPNQTRKKINYFCHKTFPLSTESFFKHMLLSLKSSHHAATFDCFSVQLFLAVIEQHCLPQKTWLHITNHGRNSPGMEQCLETRFYANIGKKTLQEHIQFSHEVKKFIIPTGRILFCEMLWSSLDVFPSVFLVLLLTRGIKQPFHIKVCWQVTAMNHRSIRAWKES